VSSAVVAGKRAVLEALRTGGAAQVFVARGARTTPGLREVLSAAERIGVDVRELERHELDALAADHRGVVAKVRVPSTLGERDLATWPFGERDLVVALDGVTDPQNLGAAARAAEAAGASMLVTRTRRAASVTDAAVRASVGALLHLPHARVANLARALERLKDASFVVVGLDATAPRSVYDEPVPDARLALVIGSEGEGMARLTREACDVLIALPMLGEVGSLNASAALAAVLYAWVVPSRRVADGA
jgi:23S rRNA (guanosine2251-2'-O)-methyltransferase